MSDVKELEDLKVADLPVTEFVKILHGMFQMRSGRLADMTIEEFMERMIQATADRSYRIAEQESQVAEQVLTDWKGLMAIDAVTQPYRCRTPEEAQKFGSDLAATVASGCEVVVVVGVVSGRSYGKWRAG